MNVYAAFGIELVLTVVAAFLLVYYLVSSLHRVLVDLCGTDDRARFWSVFTRILLIGAPAVAALGYRPEQAGSAGFYFDITAQLSRNLTGLLAAVVAVGLVITLFAATAPRASRERPS